MEPLYKGENEKATDHYINTHERREHVESYEKFIRKMWKLYIKEKKLRKCTEQIAKQGYERKIKPIEKDFTVAVLRKGK